MGKQERGREFDNDFNFNFEKNCLYYFKHSNEFNAKC